MMIFAYLVNIFSDKLYTASLLRKLYMLKKYPAISELSKVVTAGDHTKCYFYWAYIKQTLLGIFSGLGCVGKCCPKILEKLQQDHKLASEIWDFVEASRKNFV